MSLRIDEQLALGLASGALATAIPFATTLSPTFNRAAARGGRAVGFALGRGGRGVGFGLRGAYRGGARAGHIALKTGAVVAPVGGRFLGRSGSFTFRRTFRVAKGLAKAEAVIGLFIGAVQGGAAVGRTLARGGDPIQAAQAGVSGFVAGFASLTGVSESQVHGQLFGTTRGFAPTPKRDPVFIGTRQPTSRFDFGT